MANNTTSSTNDITTSADPAPVITSITLNDAAQVPANATTLSYTVTFSSSVTGVDAGDFSLTGTGSASGTIAGSTGSGTTYIITVDALRGNGSLRLDLNSSGTGITDLYGTPVAGGFTSGSVHDVDRVAPTTTVSSVALSADTGTFGHFITKIAAQTISGTLTTTLAANETVQISLDNGASWTNAAAVGQTFSAAAMLTGSNTLQVRVVDAAGNAGPALSQAYVLDTSAPSAPSTPDLVAASDSGASSIDNITNIRTPTFTGTAESGATVGLYDTDGTTLLGSAVATDGTWSITSPALTEGIHSVTVKATDLAGNVGAASPALAVTIDTSAPTLTISSNVAEPKAGETATITFTFSEDPGASFTWDGTAGDVVVSGGTLSAISGTGLTRTATFTPTLDTDNGAASITVAAGSYADAAGNGGGAGAMPTLTFDTKSPSLTISSDVASLNAGQTATITFTFSEDPGSSFTWDGTAGDVVVSGGTLSAISGTGLTRTATFTPTPGTDNGTASFTVAADSYADAAGNLGGVGATPSLTFDTKAPTVIISLSDTALTAGETATVTITFSEAVSGLVLGNFTAEGGTLSDLTTSDGITYSAILTPSANLADNSNLITLNPAGVIDLAGNMLTGLLVSPNYSIDTVPTPPVGGGGGQPPTPAPGVEVGGGNGTDSLVSTPADEVFDGGGGTDSVVFSGNFADYVVVVENGMPVSITGPDGSDRFISIERLVFADGTLAFDDIAVQGSRLYEAAFDRSPDAPGMGFWVGERDAERGDLVWMASHFLHSDEFRDLYGAPEDMSNQRFLELMYENVLDRSPDVGGFNFWMDQLDSGYGRERLMVAFSESVENVGTTPIEGVWYQ